MKIPVKKYYNYTMGFLLLYSFLGITISSYILWFVLPMGKGWGGDFHCGDTKLTGMGELGNTMNVFEFVRYQWVNIHSWIAIVAVVLVVVHLFLNWQWIIDTVRMVKNYMFKRQKAILERYIVSLTLFFLTIIQILSGFVLWLILPRGVGDRSSAEFGFGRTFWGLQRNEWVDAHAWVAVFMVAIVIVHLIIHWRWIINMTLGKIKPTKAPGTVEPEGIQQIDKLKAISESNQPVYLRRAGMFIGMVGAVCFLVALLTFQLDPPGRYGFMLYFIPIPFICVLLVRKWPLIGGTLLIMIGILIILLYLIFPVGIKWNEIGVWNELGLETIYTLVFVTLPLVVSGILFLISRISKKSRMHRKH